MEGRSPRTILCQHRSYLHLACVLLTNRFESSYCVPRHTLLFLHGLPNSQLYMDFIFLTGYYRGSPYKYKFLVAAMPPKRWAKPIHASFANPEVELSSFIREQIKSNNCLSLADEEVEGMTKELLSSRTREEVYNWCSTLLLSESIAAEIIKYRADQGPSFEGESAASSSQAAATANNMRSARSLTLPTRRGKRSVNITKLPKEKKEVAALKPGRFQCGCFATIHGLRTSCANCGRIICEQEADDLCYFCGFEPQRCVAYEIALQEGKISEAAMERNRDNYEAAVSQRDTLLEYAKHRSKRTTVIDDQSASLFSPQSAWLSQEERKKVHEKLVDEDNRKIEQMHRHKGAYQVHLDFVNENVALGARSLPVAEGKPTCTGSAEDSDGSCDPDFPSDDETDEPLEIRAEPLPSLLQKIWYSPDGSSVANTNAKNDPNGLDQLMPRGRPIYRHEEVSRRVQQDYYEDDLTLFAEEALDGKQTELVFSIRDTNIDDFEREIPSDGSTSNLRTTTVSETGRFAPTQAMLSKDEGVCLSMHQPWASLLVAGIKTHEGRAWSTTYRGRLWIHSASAQPTDVEEVERHYAPFMLPGQSFPKHYPTKVLLGYVYLTDCLDTEAYESAFPAAQRQEGSSFSFICANAQQLLFPLPMDGNHKLFQLNRKVLVAARKQLGEVN